LADEIALLQVRVIELLGRLDNGESGKCWRQVRDLFKRYTAEQHTEPGQRLLTELGEAIRAGAIDYDTWDEITQTVEQKRKLAATEVRRLQLLNQFLPVEQAMLLAAQLAEAVRRHVSNPQTLAAIYSELKLLVNQPVPSPAECLG
jgi:hypothetical protein